jgi:hypothetical protein
MTVLLQYNHATVAATAMPGLFMTPKLHDICNTVMHALIVLLARLWRNKKPPNQLLHKNFCRHTSVSVNSSLPFLTKRQQTKDDSQKPTHPVQRTLDNSQTLMRP